MTDQPATPESDELDENTLPEEYENVVQGTEPDVEIAKNQETDEDTDGNVEESEDDEEPMR